MIKHVHSNFSNGMSLKSQIVKALFCLKILSFPKTRMKRIKRVEHVHLYKEREIRIFQQLKVMKHDLEKLKSGLEVCSNCPFVGLLADNDCMPSDYDVNKLPSRQSLLELKGTKCNLETIAVRDAIVSKLTESTDFSLVPGKQCKTFVANNKFNIDHDACLEIEKNTRAQSNCAEWHSERKSRLTASLFGHVMNRRKNIYPKSIVNKIVQSSHTTSTSCKWGTDNEQNALLKYYESMQSNEN